MGDIPKDGTSIKVDDLSSDDTLTNLQDIPGDDTSVFSEATPDDKPEDICLIEYLFKRLYQLGVRSICGVPGDYNLTALDYVQPCGLRWVGNANELNAAYAADGYARLNGVSVLMTVMGVGELSAMNAIAGAYTEKVPIVHIVGMPSTRSQQLKHNLHHSLGDGDFGRFSTLYKTVTCGQIMLDGSSAVMQVMIDDILRQCLRHSRPVYIGLPTDLIKRKVSAGRLVDEPLLRAENAVTRAQKIQHSRVMAVNIRATVQKYRRPVVVVDGFASQYGFVKAVNQLVRFSGIPTFTTPFGKGIVDETSPNFHGIYTGAVWWSKDDEKWVYPDFYLYIAPLKADTNTCCFTAMSGVSKVIEIGQYDVSIKSASLRCDSKTILEILSMPPFWHIPVKLDPRYGLRDRKGELERLPDPCADAVLDQDSFWFRISKFFKPGDVILTETGTASLGGQDFVLPPATKMINSGAWLSIGYTLGASVGAALAQADARGRHPNPTKGRTILFEGDGSFQMTAQAVSDIIRNRLDVIIFLINNDGYTIERLINGMDADYNAVQPWNYLESASYFGAPKNDPSYPVFAKRANNWGELYEVIKEPQLVLGKGFNMVEVMMRKEDATASLKEMVQLSKQQNSGKDTLA